MLLPAFCKVTEPAARARNGSPGDRPHRWQVTFAGVTPPVLRQGTRTSQFERSTRWRRHLAPVVVVVRAGIAGISVVPVTEPMLRLWPVPLLYETPPLLLMAIVATLLLVESRVTVVPPLALPMICRFAALNPWPAEVLGNRASHGSGSGSGQFLQAQGAGGIGDGLGRRRGRCCRRCRYRCSGRRG